VGGEVGLVADTDVTLTPVCVQVSGRIVGVWTSVVTNGGLDVVHLVTVVMFSGIF